MQAEPPRGRGLSLWWMPPEPLARRLQGLVDALAGRLGTPAFPPHVTVDSGLQGAPETLITRVSEATCSLTAPLLRPQAITTADAWNRALVVEIDTEDHVLDARLAVAFALGRTVQRSTFRPHLSLAYGPLPEARRATLARTLTLTLPAFTPTALALVDTDGPVHQWWELHRWPLPAG